MALPDFEENHSLGERVVVVDVAREGAESILRDSGQEAGGGSGEGEDKPGPQTSEGQEKSRRVRVLSQIGWLRHHAQGCERDVTTIIRGCDGFCPLPVPPLPNSDFMPSFRPSLS